MLISLTIIALAPLAFPERKAGTQFRKSFPYVPGATIYGALGSRCYEPALFEALRCHNAYPAQEGDSWVRPMPATAIQPKGKKDIHDSLVERVCWERQQPAALIYSPTDESGRPWEAVGRTFYTRKNAANKIKTRSVQQRVLTRTAINRRRGTVQEDMLYSPLVINEANVDKDNGKKPTRTRFCGSIVIPSDQHNDQHNQAEEIRQHLETIDLLGGRQTSGLGRVRVEATESTSGEGPTDIQQRVKRLTSKFQAQAALYETLGGDPFEVGTIFTVNLLSDAILLEQGWLPTQEFSAAMLKEATGIEATLLRSFTTTQVVGGWNVSWQRPKPSEIAVSMGGVYVFRTEQEPDYARLAALQLDGIGERRAEGYGQIRICDEFHLEDNEQTNRQTNEQTNEQIKEDI